MPLHSVPSCPITISYLIYPFLLSAHDPINYQLSWFIDTTGFTSLPPVVIEPLVVYIDNDRLFHINFPG